MQIVRESMALDLAISDWVADGETHAFVPTMGALHDGHMALVEHAKTLADHVTVSIFVNPTQFNDPADLERYPRQEEADLAKLEAAGCDLVWLPSAADLYPEGFATSIHVAGLSERWEGEHRPGHFDGVATIVAKLLGEVIPSFAVFGEKDWQQLAVIRRLVIDLNLHGKIVGVPTVREADGLAMSSRNALLSEDERSRAPGLFAALNDAAAQIGAKQSVSETLESAKRRVKEAGFGVVDYLAYVDEATLEPLDDYREDGRLLAAAHLGKVRLIDNMRVD